MRETWGKHLIEIFSNRFLYTRTFKISALLVYMKNL